MADYPAPLVGLWVADRVGYLTRDGYPYSDVFHLDEHCAHFFKHRPPRPATRPEVIYGRPCHWCASILYEWRESTHGGPVPPKLAYLAVGS